MTGINRGPLWGLLAVLLVWTPLYLLCVVEPLQSVGTLVSLMLILIGGLGAVALILYCNSQAIWYPITWYLVTTAVYFGLGPLMYFAGTKESLEVVDWYWHVGEAELYETTLLNLFGIIGVVLVYLACDCVFRRTGETDSKKTKGTSGDASLLRVTVAFVALGLPIKLLLVLPRAIGRWDVVLPGSLEMVSLLSTLAIVPLYILAKSDRKRFLPLLLVLVVTEFVVALMMLSKLAMIKVALVLLLAAVLRGMSFMRLVTIGAVGAILFAFVLVPFVHISRLAFNVMGLQSAGEAVEAVSAFSDRGATDVADVMPGVQAWWVRLNYAPAQAFAIDAYRNGLVGQTFRLIPYSFVPRWLYPDKPIMTTGADFNALVTGSFESKSAPTMIFEGYWNGGMSTAVFVVVVMGCFYWVWEQYTRRNVSVNNVAFIPVAWLGLFPAIQQDSWFVPGTFGIIPFAIALHLLGMMINTWATAAIGRRGRLNSLQ